MQTRLVLLLSILLCLPAAWLHGQAFEYGNGWYTANPNRTFIKLVVNRDGVYRVSAQDLQQAGYDFTQVDARTLQLFYRGQEQPIFVNRSGNSLNYLEFYGRRNDGRIDSMMYRDPVTGLHKPDLQPNINVSLFSDASAYFLTWSTTPSGNRFFSLFDPTYSLYTPEPHFPFQAVREYQPGEGSVEYVRGGGGTYDAFYTLNSDYVTGEGYVGPAFGFGTPRTVRVATPFSANSGNSVAAEIRVFGRSNTQHILRVDYNGISSSPVLDTTWATNQVYMRTYRRNFSPPGGQLTTDSDLTFHALRAETDNNHVCRVALTYDRLPNLGGDSTIVIRNWAKNAKTYFRLTNVRGDDSVFVYDRVNRIRYKGLITQVGGVPVANFIVLASTQARDLIMVSDAAIMKPEIEAASLNNLSQAGQGAEFIIIAHRSLSSSAEAYATYRDTATVTPLSAKVVYTDEIYDEFGYGTITPWAIKRFCKYALDNWTVTPRYFLLWGKGRFITRGFEGQAVVPTYNYPATDYEFVGHFDPYSTDLNLEAAIGRVNIYDNDEGMAYLEKVAEYEHTPWDGWMKEGVFLGGGGTEGEQNSISAAFRYMINIFEDVPFGGETHYFQKNSSTVVIDPATASYHDQIDGGVQIIHFFGHSTSNIQDISIRQPFEYLNFNRYPLMIAMGCYGGDFTVNGTSFGEGWVKQPRRGAIGYLANSSAGYLNPLRDYAQVLYGNLHRRMLGEPLGDILRTTLNTYTDSLLGIQYRNHGRQMNLQGDPAVRMYHVKQPDLAITNASIFFTPDNFTAQDDSFRINIIVRNNGLVTADSFNLSVRQRLPNGDSYQHPIRRFPMVHFEDTVSFILQNPVGNAITGQNVFEVFVDSDNEVTEYDERNNLVNLSRLVPGNIPAILYPTEYAVIGENRVSLQASAFFMTRDENVRYVFEIDTTIRFDSPFKTSSGVVTGQATFVSWDVPFTLQDSMVYFWRVRLADVEPRTWGTASFKYIDSRTGWAQSRLEQFREAVLDGIARDELQREWTFSLFGAEYEFNTRRGSNFSYSLNGSLLVDACLNGFCSDGLIYVILDQYTLESKVSTQGLGQIGVAAVPNEVFRLRDAILNTEPGDYVIVGSNRNPRVPTWSEDIFAALAQIGVSDNIRLLQNGDAFLVMGRKGYPGSATEVYAPNSGDKFVINSLLLASNDEGTVRSTRVGPALEWGEMFWRWASQDVIVQETATVNVYGERSDGSDTLFMANLPLGTYDLSQVSATTFPYLRLESALVDTISRTAPQLENWHVLFTPAPDAVVDPVTNFEFRSDTVYEGQDVFIRMGVRNISEVPIDSMWVRFSLERSDRVRVVLDSVRIAPLVPNGPTVAFEYGFNTLNRSLEGDVLLLVEVNPTEERAERNYFNNVYVQSFHVVVDRKNPIMDVTFDGKHIIQGDFVSPRPEILIEVNDENRFVANDDTSAFELNFFPGTSCTGCDKRIFIEGSPEVRWEPATLPENKARLYFYPGLEAPLADGEYTLQVQGRDRKGNASGEAGKYYEISFRVENQATMTQVLNYPNPFSTSTRFVFTLTGSVVPDVFQIHIYTISGKLVKVVDLKALGDVHIGQNITNYAWDGTDEYGDRLANGVYLYRVVTRTTGESLELRDEGINQFFNNGWGKMYLMR